MRLLENINVRPCPLHVNECRELALCNT
jgi:hypothetical protein